MKRFRFALGVVTVVGICLGQVDAQTLSPVHSRSPVTTIQKRAAMPTQAAGTFDVKLTPQPPDDGAGGPALGRMTIDKQFHGDLEATSKGQMLAAMTAVKESAGYVAMEKVTGALQGRKGSFALQHGR